MNENKLIDIIRNKSLKVTPQRLLILKAILKSKSHPTADDIITFVRKQNQNIAIGTIYKILDTLVKNNIIQKVETYNDIMRYEFSEKNHHHIYLSDKNIVMDYYDSNLDQILTYYFKKKKIPNFTIENIKVHIIGKQITKK